MNTRSRTPPFGVTISREDEQICFDISAASVGLSLPLIQGRGQITLHLDRLDLSGGQYFVNVGINERNWAYAYDYHWHVYPLSIHSTVSKQGILCPPCRWEFSDLQVPNLQRH
ncbi:MAG: Wzt carbohydrate-binding domain-containing protein [Chroococcidiopsidaceae cyanobacterium CP_BM_ER_R8_30]|nr:Wzt carbohydrate-binding domain-containing protein [Chroococcidiopsidaceae cyanobacterium CP_BM_ER_R8_30]